MSLEDQLIEAAKKGNLEEIERLVSLGADIHTENDFALRIAAHYGKLVVVKYLVENGADVHSNNNAALRYAAEYGHLDVVKYLVEKGADIHSENEYALRYASEDGYLDVVKFLVENGADIHVWDESALRRAAIDGHLDIVKYLVENGADVHSNNNAALRYAAEKGHLDVVRFLVQNGADININRSEPLELALKSGHEDIVRFLVESGADIHANEGLVLRYAAYHGYLDIVKILVESDADIDIDNGSALQSAAENGKLDVVKYLVESGASLQYVDRYFLNKLLDFGHIDIIRYLARKGVDISVVDYELLLEHGLVPRPELENRAFDRIKNFNIRNIKEVYNTLPNELLYKIRSYMKVKGLDSLDIKNVYNPKHPLYKVFGEYVEDKPFLIKNFVFKIEDLNNILNKESNKFNLSYDIYQNPAQQHIKNIDNLVIQLNFKEEYLEKVFEIKGSEFKEFYENISKLSIRSGHPVLPYHGRTYGWARIYVLDQGWLVNEIQTDWKHLIAFCKQLSTIKPGEEFQGVIIDKRISQFFQTAEQREWGKFIGETMLENFDELIMSSILNVARRNGVHHIYMLTDKNMSGQGLGVSVKKDLYHKTPRKFKFHKVVTNLGAGDQEYWYRTASKDTLIEPFNIRKAKKFFM